VKIRFIWDEKKNRENYKKHGVTFEEAVTIFENVPFEVFYDPEHSEFEDRYIAVGLSNRGRHLLVVHCESRQGTVIRLISARRTTARERQTLFGGKW
jgi:hypothetical protein